MNNLELEKLNKSTKWYLKATKYLVWIPLVVIVTTCIAVFFTLTK